MTVVHNAIDIPYHRDGAVILREQFKAIGINLEIKLISSTANRAETRDKNFHMNRFQPGRAPAGLRLLLAGLLLAWRGL